MSSIYKKGRDGYYYYQAYILNPETGKKDKRVFHALNTKNFEEAKKQKISLDLKYNGKKNIKKKLFGLLKNIKFSYIYIFLIIFISYTFFSIQSSSKSSEEMSKENISVLSTLDDSISSSDSIKFGRAPTENIQSESLVVFNTEIEMINSTESKIDVTIIDELEFVIERIDSMPASFNQVKLFVTVDENITVQSQKILCIDLKNKFKNFSNILICLFSKNQLGKQLAQGLEKNFSEEQKKDAWLSMYSYNSVEGEYFDSNPGGYLGAR